MRVSSSSTSDNSMQWLCFRGRAHPPAYVTRIPGIYRGGRHVVNRAHRRTISAAPQDVSPSRRSSNVAEVSEIFSSGRRRRALLFLRPTINHPAAEKRMPA